MTMSNIQCPCSNVQYYVTNSNDDVPNMTIGNLPSVMPAQQSLIFGILLLNLCHLTQLFLVHSEKFIC